MTNLAPPETPKAASGTSRLTPRALYTSLSFQVLVAMVLAVIVVAVELFAISYIRHRYMDTPFLQAAFQVVVGGILVFLTGWLIGSS